MKLNVAARNRGNTLNALTALGIFVVFLIITVFTVYFYSPVFKSQAEGTSNTDNSEVKVKVGEVASVALDTNNLAFNIVPTSSGTFQSQAITATVSTNSTGGYELYFSSNDNDTNMSHSDSSVTDVIASDFNNAVTSSSMGLNKWGYSLDNTNFLKIPVSSAQTKIKDVEHFPDATEKNTPVYIGTKISDSLTSGRYQKTVKFSVVAHESKMTLFDISDMQDMTSTICANTTKPVKTATQFDWDGSHRGDTNYVPRKSLRDSRDGNYYLVSKLADGNCWMSQSLALDLTANTAIVASTTAGGTISVTPNNTTQTTTGATWAHVDDNWHSYKPQASENETYYQSGTTKSSFPTGSGVAYDWEKAGNYYNWYAATAGTGTSAMTGSDATASICPKGWRLPSNSGIKSYYNLITITYGLASSSDGSLALRANPLNFNLSGYYRYNDGVINARGSRGVYWSSTAYSSATSAYHLNFYTSFIYLHGHTYKGYGFSVRCVAI